MSTLDYGIIFRKIIELGTREMVEYLQNIENYLIEEKLRLHEKLRDIEILKKENEEHYDMYMDFLLEDLNNYDEFYPNNLRSSLLIQSYSFLEYYLRRICDHVFISKKLRFSVRDIKRGGEIERAKIYLNKSCGLDFGNFNPEWSFIDNVRILRNSITHSRGEFKLSDEKLCLFIKDHNSLTVKKYTEEFKSNNDSFIYEVIIIDNELNKEFILNINNFFEKLTKKIF